MLEYTIFAIDNDTDLHTVSKFLRYMDTQRVMNGVDITLLFGCYSGALENSYMIQSRHLFHVSDWIKGQESILRVPGDVRQPCALEYLKTGNQEILGPMREVPKDEAMKLHAWTYNPNNGKYFTC